MELKPISTIVANLGFTPDGKSTKFLVSTCAKHMDKYVPKREGILRGYKLIGNYIVYGDNASNKYAMYQYHGIREDGTHKVQHYTTPGTGPYWDRRMVSAEIDTVTSEVQKYVNRGGK